MISINDIIKDSNEYLFNKKTYFFEASLTTVLMMNHIFFLIFL